MSTILNSGVNNAFIKLQESASGKVSVKLQKNLFAKEGDENFFGKVERTTYSAQNIMDVMAESLPLLDSGTIASVLNAYANTLLKILSSGNAAKFGELGTFYIAGKGTVDSGTGKPSLTVKFSASQTLKNAAGDIEITSSEYVAPAASIASVTDVASGKSDGILARRGSVLIEGACLKVTGENSGIWFAPADGDGQISADETVWTKAESALVFNLPSKLLFALPQSLAEGKYRIVVRTRYAGRNGSERKNILQAVSSPVEIA